MRLTMIGLVAAFLLGGCAHPINIAPDASKLQASAPAVHVDKVVAYYISPEQRDAAVTTPGGGGDKVTYRPYKEIEGGFYKMLSNVFKDVVVLQSPDDAKTISAKSVVYVIKPVIKTDSSSPSALTWPPTHFSAELTCTVSDPTGKVVLTQTVSGQGAAEWDEFKHDFSLSGKRATQDALLKMQEVLAKAPELK
ncbi:hypothetical protein [Silvimonas sp.]|uniref:hypothetical protein n=1 Tax=Silvimonas sp. TaxID=2650811 RepID=UPI00284132E2|nr:hypothetical protein [Silvimonas sp.]MDR3426871.1 hypothetical protein [Silvimonas sp.]